MRELTKQERVRCTMHLHVPFAYRSGGKARQGILPASSGNRRSLPFSGLDVKPAAPPKPIFCAAAGFEAVLHRPDLAKMTVTPVADCQAARICQIVVLREMGYSPRRIARVLLDDRDGEALKHELEVHRNELCDRLADDRQRLVRLEIALHQLDEDSQVPAS